MTTWLDTQPATTVRCALGGTPRTDEAERRYALWLRLVDLHLCQLRVERSRLTWEWRPAYDDGWSPRTAAFAAWAKHLRPVHLAGQGS
jgi:hypothetical protein